MARFIVFDVETPNRKNNRMSAIGITVVEEGKISKEFYSLVNPETDFDYFNVKLTGISKASVKDAPTFPELWQQIEPLFSDGMLVAHNASFDMNVLKSCLLDYEIDWKPYARYICTVKMGRSLFPDRSHKLNMSVSISEFLSITIRRIVTVMPVRRFYFVIWKPGQR